MIEAVLLTAGKSSRMGKDKALLEINGRKVINIIIEKLITSITGGRHESLPLLVILGHHGESIKEAVEDAFLDKIEFVYNENHLDGMYSSIKKGVSCLTGNNPFILHMIDQPFIEQELYDKVAKEYDYKSPICQPVYIAPQPPKGGVVTENGDCRGNALVLAPSSPLNGKLGHPIIVNQELIPKIKNDNQSQSLKDFLKPYYKDIQTIEYNKNTILQNLNNYESFQNALKETKV